MLKTKYSWQSEGGGVRTEKYPRPKAGEMHGTRILHKQSYPRTYPKPGKILSVTFDKMLMLLLLQ